MIKISVITAVLNAEKTIAESIISLQSQTFKNVEHIIIDGASTDNTISIIKKYSQCKTRIISEKDSGIYEALNRGISLATGDVIGFLHADDVYAANDVLQNIADHFSNTSVTGVYGNLNYILNDDSRKIVRVWKADNSNTRADNNTSYLKKIQNGWMPPHPTLYLRRSCYLNGCKFNVGYKISADYSSILKAFLNGNNKFIYINKLLINMRVGGVSNKSLKNIAIKMYEDYKVLQENNFGICSSIKIILMKNITKLHQIIL